MVPQALKGHERPEEVTGAQDLEPIRIKEGPLLQPTAPPPTLHEETPEIVEKSPIGADLGPRSPESYSSSIVPYEMSRDSAEEKMHQPIKMNYPQVKMSTWKRQNCLKLRGGHRPNKHP